MKWMWIILTVVGVVFLGFLLMLNVAWSFLRMIGQSFDKFLNKGKPESREVEDDNIIDITPEPVNAELSENDKIEFAAKSLSDALSAVHGKVGTFEEELASLSRLAALLKNRQVRGFLSQSMRIYSNIKAIFNRDTYKYRYTSELLARCASGIDTELTRDSDDQRFAEGIQLAIKYVYDYVLRLSSLWNVAIRVDDAELSGEVAEMLGRMEMFYWIRVAYPGRAEKDSRLLEEMLASLVNKLHMVANVSSLGVNSREVLDLLDTARMTVREMNVALDRMLESALSWDLLQADAMLETMRKELRLRGLY